MDRREQKTRAAIFSSFSSLLAEKRYNKITVQDIIDGANVGRATFYYHFETKDDLLKEMCEELFGHIVSSAMDRTHTHGLHIEGSKPESVYCHLLQHLQENDNHILELLGCDSSDLFLRYFKDSMNELVQTQLDARSMTRNNPELPNDFLVNHISGSFVEMVLWWIKGGMKEAPEKLDEYFRAVTDPVI